MPFFSKKQRRLEVPGRGGFHKGRGPWGGEAEEGEKDAQKMVRALFWTVSWHPPTPEAHGDEIWTFHSQDRV